MIRMHSTAWSCAVVAILFCLFIPFASADSTQTARFEFQWAFGALTGRDDNPQLLSIEEKAVLQSGDRMKIFLLPQSDCFIYLFYRSSQGELAVLLPPQGAGSRASAGTRTMVPPGVDWFRLDDVVGIETFYLLVSARPLENLDALCEQLHAAAAGNERETVSGKILSEISRLQKKRRKLTAAAERPVRLGGNFRGRLEDTKPVLPDISQFATKVTASDIYSRTFTIDHR